MKNETTPHHGIKIGISNVLLYMGFAIPLNYSSYIMTDISHIDVTHASLVISLGNIIGTILVFIIGIAMDHTRSRFGQYRPYLSIVTLLSCAGGIALTFTFDHASIAFYVALVGFVFYLLGPTLQNATKTGIYTKMAGDDNAARNVFSSNSWTGYYIGSVLAAVSILPMVEFFGISSEAAGWRWTQLIYCIAALLGMMMIMKISRPYDRFDTYDSDKINAAYIISLVKSILTNRLAIAIVLADLCRCAGGMYLMLIVSYQTKYVFGSINYMTIAMSGMSVASVFGAWICPKLVRYIGGRKKAFVMVSVVLTFLYILLAFSPTSYTPYGFLTVYIISYFFSACGDTLVILIYADAGEYWLYKKGEDHRGFAISCQTIMLTAGTAIAGYILGKVLPACGYVTGEVMEGTQAIMMTQCVGLIPAMGYLLCTAAILLYNVSDMEMEKIIHINLEKINQK